VIYAFLGYTALKSGFSESLGATFACVARRHSLNPIVRIPYFYRLQWLMLNALDLLKIKVYTSTPLKWSCFCILENGIVF